MHSADSGFFVRIVTTHRGGATSESEIAFDSRRGAMEAC
jgi:hypothetical protein